MNHTQTPWEISHDNHDGWPLVMSGGKIVANVNAESFSAGVADLIEMPAEDNARRIVACVNACEGISTENLERNRPLSDTVRQRDELLAALQLVLRRGDAVQRSDQYMFEVLDAARNAIAKVCAGRTAPEGHNATLTGAEGVRVEGTVMQQEGE